MIEELTGRRVQYDYDAARPGDQLIYVSDHRKFTADTGWRPLTNVRQTVQKIYEFLEGEPATAIDRPERNQRSCFRLERCAAMAGTGEDGMRFALVNPNWEFTGSTYFGCQDPHVPLELLYRT